MPDVRFPVTCIKDVAVVAAPEEIDATNAEGLRAVLLEAATGHQVTMVDMTRTRFCDSAGLHALIGARKRALGRDGTVVLVAPGEAVLRILSLTGVGHLIPSFATMAEALSYAADSV
jgi:stage II sporulation protein AA (anti-sigma F factor antagonist)